MFTRGPSRKAAGTDGIQEELVKAAPRQVARLMAPIMTKICLTGIEPIAFKHSRLAEVSKAIGDSSTNKAYRAVTICN
eukprot:8452486-Pyramimonas_sp.AAC.1